VKNDTTCINLGYIMTWITISWLSCHLTTWYRCHVMSWYNLYWIIEI
jgi:hypothetical protein